MKNLRLYELNIEYESNKRTFEFPTVTYVKENDNVHFLEKPKNILIGTYQANSTTAETQIFGATFDINQIFQMYVDDVLISEPVRTYIFPSKGQHVIKCIMDDSVFRSCNNMFARCYNLLKLDLSSFNTSKITDMSYMFYNCQWITSIDFSYADTSKVTTMKEMFRACNRLETLDLSTFNTSSCINMDYMLAYCTKLNSIIFGQNFGIKYTNMIGMFAYCNELTHIDLQNMNTAELITCSNIFASCINLSGVTFPQNFGVKCTDISDMFLNCTNLTTIDLSPINTSNIEHMNEVFANCLNLTSVTMTQKIVKLKEAKNMFHNITTSGIFTYNNMYDYSLILQQLPPTWSVTTLTNFTRRGK